MGRQRAKYARTETDRNVFEHLEKAESSLKKAATVYEVAIRNLPSSSLSEKRKLRDRVSRIQSALAALNSIRPIQSRYEVIETPKRDRKRDDR